MRDEVEAEGDVELAARSAGIDSSGSPSPSSSSILGKRWRKMEMARVTTVALALGS